MYNSLVDDLVCFNALLLDSDHKLIFPNATTSTLHSAGGKSKAQFTTGRDTSKCLAVNLANAVPNHSRTNAD